MRNLLFPVQHKARISERPAFTEIFPEAGLATIALQGQTKTVVLNYLQDIQDWKTSGYRKVFPKNLLISGKDGNGKRTLARAIAGEANLPIIICCAEEWADRPLAETVRLFDHLLQRSSHTAMIVFIDHFEYLTRPIRKSPTLWNSEEHYRKQLYQQLLSLAEMHTTLLMAASSHPEELTSYLLDQGVFQIQLHLSLPNRPLREDILRIQTRSLRLAHDVFLPVLAMTTTGLTGKQVTQICQHAAWIAYRKGNQEVRMADFDEALEHLLVNGARTFLLNDHERRMAAYREAGRAIIAWSWEDQTSVSQVSILPEGSTAQLITATISQAGESRLTKATLLLAGRAAEEITMNDTSPRALADYRQAAVLLGQADAISPDENRAVGIEAGDSQLDRRYQLVLRQLRAQQGLLNQVADRLINDETLEREDLFNILGADQKVAQTIV